MSSMLQNLANRISFLQLITIGLKNLSSSHDANFICVLRRFVCQALCFLPEVNMLESSVLFLNRFHWMMKMCNVELIF